MIAVFVNMATVLAGSLIGIFFSSRLRESLQHALLFALGLCTVVIGVSSAVATGDILCVILCMAFGTALGSGRKARPPALRRALFPPVSCSAWDL